MSRSILGVCAAFVLATIASLGMAQAATVDFTFSNGVPSNAFGGTNWGNMAGTVTGRIFGLNPNGSNQTASDIQILSARAAFGFSYPFDIPTYAATLGEYVAHNSFHLVNGIVQSDSEYQIQGGAFDLLVGSINSFASNGPAGTGAQVGNSLGFAGVTFSQATPLPAALPMFASGMACLGALYWRRKRKQLA